MPYRHSLSAPRYDEHGRDTWPALNEDEVRDEVLSPERDHGPHPQTHCQTCSKPLSARLLCHACGDCTDHPTWVRPDAAEGVARVFDGDVGDRRRAEDEKAA